MGCVEDTFNARTPLADFFSILSERDGGGDGNAWTTDNVEDWGQLDAFSIDRYEVPLSLYRKFLEETKHESLPTWDDEAATSVGDRPAVGMRWDSATAYC